MRMSLMLNKTVTVTAAAALLLAGCATPTSPPTDGTPQVLTALYPLEFLTQQVAGELASVTSVTPQGAEPHDLELAPAQVREIGAADLIVYIGGFQPALDDAVAQRPPRTVVDATEVLALSEGIGHEDEDDDVGHEDDDGDHEADHDHAHHDHDGDPHFWLDPTLLARLAAPVADALAELDPDNATTYAANAERVAAELSELDLELATGLATCERDVVVVSHEAFGFLAERYGLTQVGLSGIDPEGEPSPARLREIRAVVAEHDVTTIFTETLVSPKAAEVLAADLGISTALLDPVETQVDPDADYRDVMRSNLEALRLALGCA